MSGIGDEIGKVAALVAPEIGIPAAAAKIILDILGVLAIGGIIMFVVWKLLFAQHQAEQKSQQVQIQASQETGKAAVAAGQDAVRIVVDNGKGAATVDAAVKGAVDAILATKGAQEHIDPALDAVGRHSICMRDSAAGLPECQSLQHAGP